jgi:dipeptidyl aminopeptidase/acylaminoacyl peptidase
MRLRRMALVTFGLLSLVVAFALLPASAAHATFPGRNGLVAFISNRELFVRAPDGSEHALTDNSAQSIEPALSADGRKLAFTSDRDGDYEIYVVDPEGKRLKQLTRDRNVDETSPKWYPDGTRIAFIRRVGSPTGTSELWVMRPDGREQRRLARMPAGIA